MDLKLAAAFAAIYLVWGSTYLAIRVGVEAWPPFLMAGARFVLAGAVLYAVLRWRGAPRPSRRDWAEGSLVGALLFVGGNGGLTWAELHVPSGLAALLVATVPLWVALFTWRSSPGPRGRQLLGLGLGLAGVLALLGPSGLAGAPDLLGAGVILAGALAWAAGSVASKRFASALPVLLAASLQMLAGGALLLLASAGAGELAAFDAAQLTPRAWGAFAYLTIVGALVGFTSFAWLLRTAGPAKTSTYAFVNPVVAMALGALLAGEPFTPRVALAGVLVVAAVATLTLGAARAAPRGPRPGPAAGSAALAAAPRVR